MYLSQSIPFFFHVPTEVVEVLMFRKRDIRPPSSPSCTYILSKKHPLISPPSIQTFALAGVFGLDIHVISLLDPSLTEEELGTLFTTLPGRCIVLLEDIDTAGLVKRESEPSNPGPTENGEDQLNVQNLARALKKANQLSEEEKKKGITLSGLLNIIDGKSNLHLLPIFELGFVMACESDVDGRY